MAYKKVAVAGAGAMGAGIAQVLAASLEVVLHRYQRRVRGTRHAAA